VSSASDHEFDDFNFTNNWFDITAMGIWDDLMSKIRPKTVLEIGSYEGASACYLIRKFASQYPIELHCVDTWEGGGAEMPAVEARFHKNIELARKRATHNANVIVHKGRSERCLVRLLSKELFDYFDIIYIDGSHTSVDVLSDAVMSFQLLKIGGTMIFDDYLWRQNSGVSTDCLDTPKPAIDAFLNIFFHKMRIYWSPNSQVFAEKMA
jgi:predicted O-methyltransferase YrrM